MIFFKLREKPNANVFCNGVHFKPPGEKRNSFLNKKYNIAPDIQKFFTKTCQHFSTYFLGFNSMTHNKGIISARMKDAMYELPKINSKSS